MEYNPNNNWNQNNTSGSYSAQDGYTDGQQHNNNRRQNKGVSLAQLVACLLIVAVLSSGLTVFFTNRNANSPATTAQQDDSLVVNEPSNAATTTEEPTTEETQSQQSSNSGSNASDQLNIVSSTQTASSANSYQDVIQQSMASVVGIYMSTTTISYTTGNTQEEDVGSGSGVIITSDGYIVTNNHVVEDGQDIRVCLQDGSEYQATLIGTDSYSDLAIIKIDATDLPAATLGDSSKMVVGDPVFAIGNPLGVLASSVSQGIISGLDRTITVEGHNMTLIQTDAAVNPGNSGGGLFNTNGELIGIVNAKSYGIEVEGIGFAIPMNSALPIMQDLMDLGYVTGRPYLGISMQDVALRIGSNNYNSPFGMFSYGGNYITGVQIVAVEAGSPAEEAGIQVNDILIALNDQEVSGSSELSAMLYEYNVGDTVTISVLRGNETKDLALTLGERAS